jgi:hypothetical protein
MEEDPKIISQQDLDLTENELNKIFFGSEKPASESEKSKKVFTRTPKLVRQEKLSESDKIGKEIQKEIESPVVIDTPPEDKENQLENTETPKEEKEIKRPWGRPKKWTDDKILQLKAERKAQIAKKRAEKSGYNRLSKLSTQEPITKYESAKLIDKAITTKDEIEKEVSEKRKNLKEILGKQNNNFLDHKGKCQNHVYKFHSFDMNGVLVICKECSAEEHLEIKEWYKYLATHRKEL